MFKRRQAKRFSLYGKVLLVLLGVCIVFALLYGIFSARLMYAELRDQLYASNASMLVKTDYAVQTLLDNVERSIFTVAQNKDVISCIIAPSLHKVERNFDVVRYLQTTASNLKASNRIILYVKYDETVFTSDSVVVRLEDYAGQELIRGYLSTSVESEDVRSDITTTYLYDGQLFLCYDFPLNSPYCNGTLLFQIDPDALYASVNNGSEPNVYILNERDIPLLSGFLDYSVLGLSQQNIDRMRHAGSGLFSPASLPSYQVFYYYTSPSGWMYIYPVVLERLQQLYTTVFQMIAPIFIVSLLLSAVIASYFSRSIYQPIRRLTDLTTRGDYRWNRCNQDQALNEMEYLGMAYCDAVDSCTKLASIVEQSRETLLEKTFYSLMKSREYEPKDVENMLSGLDTPYRVDGIYQVIVLDVLPKDGTRANFLQTELYKTSIQNLLDNIPENNGSHFFVTMDAGRIALVVYFSLMSKTVALQGIQNWLNAIQKEADTLPCQMLMGMGKYYRSIFDLKFSYREATEALNYQTYYSNAAMPLPAKEALQCKGEEFYAKRAVQLAETLFNIQPDGASLTERVLNEMTGDDQCLEDVRSHLLLLADALYHMLGEERLGAQSALEDRAEVIRKLWSLNDKAELREYAKGLCVAAGEYFNVCNSRKKYRYALRAREYIEEHFKESTLSLNEVAESINITPAYLSRIFKEYQQRNFTDYLNEMRIHRAEMYITTTDMPISEIGFKCGFSTAQNFNRVFRRYKQVTPGQYREDHMRTGM